MQNNIISSLSSPVRHKSSRPTVFLFSGQGSHYYKMGKELYATNWRFRHWMNKLDEIATGHGYKSIVRELYYSNSTSRPTTFNDLTITHLAIFMIQYSLAQILMEEGVQPDYLFGTSLGEIIAACVGECINIEDAVLLVSRQAYFFNKKAKKGSMIAVLSNIDTYHNTPLLHDNSCIAAQNYDGHFVLSGDATSIAHIEQYLAKKNIPNQVLDVTVGFHSKVIDSLYSEWALEVEGLHLMPAKIPVISSSSSSIIFNMQTDHFWNCVRLPIRFNDTTKWFIEKYDDLIFIDIGPSATSSGFLKKIDVAHKHNIISVMNMYGRDTSTFNTAVNKYHAIFLKEENATIHSSSRLTSSL